MRGDRVLHRREQLGLTQVELAELTGLKQFHISRIENGGIKDVKGETLRKLAQALRVTTDYLLDLSDDPGTQEDEDEESHTHAAAPVA